MISRRRFFTSGVGVIALGALCTAALSGCSSSTSSSTAASSGSSASANASSTSNGASSASSATTSGGAAASGGACIVCFSATGNTWSIAEKLASATGAQLMRIEAAEPYSSEDLNYNDSSTRATVEQNGGTARPAISGGAPDLSAFDTVYLGYPIWWGKAPRIILTLLESADLAGKTVHAFCTSGSSAIDGSLSEIEAAAPNATWSGARRFATEADETTIADWAKSL